MKHFFRFFFIFLIICSFSTYSQTIRKVLIEEGTNASCGPCASQNPKYLAWIEANKSRVIPIMYHAWWPGKTDPMYLYDSNMNKARINYYGFASIGVPAGVMAGQFVTPTGNNYKGSVGDTAAWTLGLAKQEFYSPLKIDLKIAHTNGTGKVNVDVYSAANLNNKMLRVVVCESHHHYDSAGTNKEKEFYFVARQMLPDYNGTPITLAAGESKSYEFDFSVDPTFGDTTLKDSLYAVAFIQDDLTKEIYQANWTVKIEDPQAPDYALFLNQFDLTFIGKEGTSEKLEAFAVNNTDEDVTFMINAFKSSQTPKDWNAKVIDDKYLVTVGSKSNQKVQVQLTIGPTTAVGEVSVTAQLQGLPTSFETRKLTGISENIERFHILGGESEQSLFSIVTKTRGNNVFFNIPSLTFNLAYDKFTSLKTIVWTGSTNGDVTALDGEILKKAMDNGIGVLISGGKITSGLSSAGLLTKLGVGFIAYCREGYGSSPWPVTLRGVPGEVISYFFPDSIAGNLINWLLPLFRINNKTTTFPVMTFRKSLDSIFAFKTQLPNARVVVLGINPYVILNGEIRDSLISRSIEWIEGTITGVEEEPQIRLDMKAVPNPFVSSTKLLIASENRTQATIYIANALGQKIMNIYNGSLEAGTNTFSLDLQGIPNQMLFVVVNIDGKIKSIPIVKQE